MIKGLLYLVFFAISILNFSSSKLRENNQNDNKSDLIIIYASISKDDHTGKLKVENDKFDPTTYIASAKYTVGLEKIGWDLIAVSTNKNFNDEVQAEAAGFLEGYLTRKRIWDHWRNLNGKSNWRDSNNMPEYLKNYFRDQEAFIEEMYNIDKTDSIFANAYYMLVQLRGLRAAYSQYMPEDQQIQEMEFHTMTSFGDIFDLIYYKNEIPRPKFHHMEVDKILSFILTNNHCSALFKTKEDLSDIYFGHNAWFYYSAMNRMFKEYNFNFNHPSVKSRNIIFSSYPATIASMDDFYITSQDLAVIETTNAFFNQDLYDNLTPKSLLTWQRAMIANRVSSSAKEWTGVFGKYNSGTYNNMFMALDMKKVDLEQQIIEDEAMFIIEQVPGTTEINDVTIFLRYGYWPSYNTPFSNEIKKLSNIDLMIKRKPELSHSLDYNTCARANLFRRDQGKVETFEDFKKLLRYNDYENDPLSLNNPSNAIACRADLKTDCVGAYDGKASSVKMTKGKKKTISIILGPSNDDQQTFNWKTSEKCKYDPHYGLPEVYNYNWYIYTSEFYDEKLYPIENHSLKYLQ